MDRKHHSHARKRSWGSSVQDDANHQLESRVDCPVKKHQTAPPPITSATLSYTTAYVNPAPPILDSHFMARETAIPQSATNAPQPHSQGHACPGLDPDDEDSVMVDSDALSDDEALGGSMGRLDMSQEPDDVNMESDRAVQNQQSAIVDERPQVPTAAEKKPRLQYKMGYRKDCEKCQLRVPGHYAHIF